MKNFKRVITSDYMFISKMSCKKKCPSRGVKSFEDKRLLVFSPFIKMIRVFLIISPQSTVMTGKSGRYNLR